MTPPDPPVTIRRADEQDTPGILALLRDALGWRDPRYAELYAWKHRDGAFGPSPAWVAVAGERIVGLRALMRWEFVLDDQVIRAVHAVDTATHPDFQRRGLFTRLTATALEALENEGVAFVFNTPNERSRPGYLQMGWQVVGRLPVAVRPASLRGLVRITRARASTLQWSEPTSGGRPAAEVVNDRALVSRLLAARPPATGLRTRLSPEYLAWRYGPAVLGYRALLAADDAGLAIFRVRPRGGAREAVLCELLVAGHDRRLRRDLARRVARSADADYLIGVVEPRGRADGLVPLPRQGPILTWRGLSAAAMPPRRRWHLTLGDIERL